MYFLKWYGISYLSGVASGRQIVLIRSFVKIVPRTLLGFATFSIVFSLHTAKGASPAIFHFHETLIGIGFHIGATNRFELI